MQVSPHFFHLYFLFLFLIFRTEFDVQCVLSRLCGGHHQYEQSASPKNRFVPAFLTVHRYCSVISSCNF